MNVWRVVARVAIGENMENKGCYKLQIEGDIGGMNLASW